MRTLIVAMTAALLSTSAPAQQTPDFSGVWAHPSLNALERLLSGPGSVRNRSRLRTGPQAGVGNAAQLVGDYTNPILQPWAAEVVKQFGEISVAGKGYPTPHNLLTRRNALRYFKLWNAGPTAAG
jgi:hypothetical protein